MTTLTKVVFEPNDHATTKITAYNGEEMAGVTILDNHSARLIIHNSLIHGTPKMGGFTPW